MQKCTFIVITATVIILAADYHHSSEGGFINPHNHSDMDVVAFQTAPTWATGSLSSNSSDTQLLDDDNYRF